ncbi:MAG: hypothetical protein KDB61_10765, partial [Planctomycetes bacterium]|nr:hypothetical protein [Planctomycetota bacterium]
MDKAERGEARAMNPGELLTVLQAAEWSGHSVSTVRRRMESGELRFEILREKGRDVQRIRWVDLCDLYPELLDDTPTASAPQPGKHPSDSPVAEAGEDPGDTHSTPMGLSLQSLTEQRDDLREQCYDLRIRLSQAEKERQVAVGALLQAQQQFLAVDGHSTPHGGVPLWKRGGFWALTVCAGGFLWILAGMLDRQAETISESQAAWARTLSEETQERLKFQGQRMDGERRAMQDRWLELENSNKAQQAALLAKWEQDQATFGEIKERFDTLEERSTQTQQLVQSGWSGDRQVQEAWRNNQAEESLERWKALREETLGVLRAQAQV